MSLEDRRNASERKFADDQAAEFRLFARKVRNAASWVAERMQFDREWVEAQVERAVKIQIGNPPAAAADKVVAFLAEEMKDPSRAEEIRSRMI